MIKKSKKKTIATVIVLAIIGIYCAGVLSTNALWAEIERAFVSTKEEYESDDLGIPEYIFVPEYCEDIGKIEAEIQRVFVLHNFFDGYIWASYTRKIYNKRGEMIYGAVSRFPRLLKIKIHRDGLEWMIVNADIPAY